MPDLFLGGRSQTCEAGSTARSLIRVWLSDVVVDVGTRRADDEPMKNAKVLFLILAVMFVAILVIQNTEEVVTKLLFAEVRMPHAVLLFTIFVLGFAAGAVTTMRVQKRKKVAA